MEHVSTSYLQKASKALNAGDYNAAEKLAKFAISIDSRCADAFHILGIIKCVAGEFTEAEEFLLKAAGLDKKNGYIFFNLGKCLSDQGKHDLALKWHRKAIELDRSNSEFWLNFGISLVNLGKLEESLSAFDSIIKTSPNHPQAWFNKTAALLKLGKLEAGLKSSERNLELSPASAEAWKIHGIFLGKLGLPGQASEAYSSSLKINRNQADTWQLLGTALYDINQLDQALESLSVSIKLDSTAAAAFLNRGVVLQELEKLDDAISDFSTARTLDDKSALTHFSLGTALAKKYQYLDAAHSYEEALKQDHNYAPAWHNLGIALSELKRYEDAIKSYIKALQLGMDDDFLLGNLIHTKLRICDWTDFNIYLEQLKRGLERRSRVTTPLIAICLFDSPSLQKSAAEIYSTIRCKQTKPIYKCTSGKDLKKIRIAYFSMDFREHPVGHLIAELFELHDRSQFEVYGVSFGINTQDSLRRRIEKSFDRFMDVFGWSTTAIEQLCQDLNFDVAIDLGGFTKDARPEIFAKRIAPIQINYLGFPGTMGSENYDYILADQVLIPSNYQEFFAEKVIYLPNCFQVNDRKRKISENPSSRSQHNLPDHGFVFCCFNNTWKLLPEIFDLWIEILTKVDDSVLWFRADNSVASKNLRTEAEKRGVDPARLVFAEFTEHDLHLARYTLADVFLDTYPYNGHTTTSDALWAGLPVLTIEGSSYASRVASSLLRCLDLDELITNTFEEYVQLAVELSRNRPRLGRIKEKLDSNRVSAPLFDTPLFTKHIESAYKAVYQVQQSGRVRDHIYVRSGPVQLS
jgi:protein O-GlcNAc transferase